MLSLQAVLAVNALIVAILALILKGHYSHLSNIFFKYPYIFGFDLF